MKSRAMWKFAFLVLSTNKTRSSALIPELCEIGKAELPQLFSAFNFKSFGFFPMKSRTSGFILCGHRKPVDFCFRKPELFESSTFHWINFLKEFCVLRKGVKSSGFPISLSSGIISIPKTVKLSEIMWIILPQWSCWFVPYHENWPLWGLVQIFCSIMEVCSFGWSTSTWSSFSRCWKFDVKKVKVNFHFSCLFTFFYNFQLLVYILQLFD